MIRHYGRWKRGGSRTDDRGRGVTVAHRPFKPGGGGSSPSGPMTRGSRGAARSSVAEHPADNREGEVRFLPGRSGGERCYGTKVLAAASLALNQAGEGSSPSGPTRRNALEVRPDGRRPRKAEERVRLPPGALGSLTIRRRRMNGVAIERVKDAPMM